MTQVIKYVRLAQFVVLMAWCGTGVLIWTRVKNYQKRLFQKDNSLHSLVVAFVCQIFYDYPQYYLFAKRISVLTHSFSSCCRRSCHHHNHFNLESHDAWLRRLCYLCDEYMHLLAVNVLQPQTKHKIQPLKQRQRNGFVFRTVAFENSGNKSNTRKNLEEIFFETNI